MLIFFRKKKNPAHTVKNGYPFITFLISKFMKISANGRAKKYFNIKFKRTLFFMVNEARNDVNVILFFLKLQYFKNSFTT